MKERCLNPNAVQYPHYGGRGITICDRWLNFDEFEEDMKSSFEPGFTLDRIDNNKGYFAENCRWSSHKKQCRNRRSNKLITYKGETLPVVEMAEKYQIEYKLLKSRIEKKWPVERAITEPKRGIICKL